MQFSNAVTRFSLGDVPVIGNTVTGAVVGLTEDGIKLCDALGSGCCGADAVSVEQTMLLEYLVRNGFVVDEGKESSAETASRLETAYLHVTNRCNMACKGCYSYTNNRNDSIDPTYDELAHSLRVLAKIGISQLVVSGGEPFLRDDLPALVAYANDVGIQSVNVLTNGTLCAPSALELLSDCVDVISVLFNNTGDWVRSPFGNDCRVNQIKQAVKRIAEAGIRPHILFTLHAENIGDVPEMLEFGKQSGATVGFSLLSGKREMLGELFPTDDQLRFLARVIHEVGEWEDISTISPDISEWSLRACKQCGAGITTLSISAEGNVYPCHTLHYPEYCCGNAFLDSAKDIQSALSKMLLPSVDELDDCNTCSDRYICGGGCRARMFLNEGFAEGKDPYCAYYSQRIDFKITEFLSSVLGEQNDAVRD